MNKDKIITELYNSKELDKVISNITRGHYLKDDLKSELFYILCKMPYEKLATAKEKGYLLYLCINILKKQYHSSTSPFHRKYRVFNKASELDINIVDDNDKDPYLEFEEFVLKEINTVLKTCPYIDRELFKIYYKLDEYDRWIGEKRDRSCDKPVSSTRKIEKKLVIKGRKGVPKTTIDHSTIAKSLSRTRMRLLIHFIDKKIKYEF